MAQTRLAIPAEVQEYLGSATQSILSVLGDNLLGLYLCGSAVQGDFDADRSDIDLLGVVADELEENVRARLAGVLSHERRPVPGRGLEIVLFPANAARVPQLELPFAFALSTGPGFASDCEPPGIANDMLIDVMQCRAEGHTLHGPPADALFGPVPMPVLRAALIEELHWHVEQVDKTGDSVSQSNAILNAARSWDAAETGRIVSKAEGAKIWLERNPHDALVTQALAYREKRKPTGFDPAATRSFVQAIIERIEALQNKTV